MQEMKLMSFLVCTKIEFGDADKNQTRGINGIFDRIITNDVPCTGPLNVFFRFACENGDYKIRINFNGPSGLGHFLSEDGKPVVATPFEIPFKATGKKFHDVRLLMDNKLLFMEWGNYKFVVEYGPDFSLKAEYPITVEKTDG